MRTPPGGTYLPRAGVVRNSPGTVVARADKEPWELEAEAGEPEVPSVSERPGTIVATSEIQVSDFGRPGKIEARDLGRAAGSQRTGLRHVWLAAGEAGGRPHCHSAEEELFVVLAGEGECRLGDDLHAVRRGSVVSRPAGTGVPHSFRAGDGGLTFLAYGTREPSDIAYFPETREVSLRGVGVRFVVPS
jgi:uncharacterized cupin superfamily protein